MESKSKKFIPNEIFTNPTLHTLLLALLVFVFYIPSMRAGFIWDDGIAVVDNVNLRTIDGLWKIWFHPLATSEPHYWPLTYSVFWIGYHIWGVSPFGYHLLNILIHALNSILVWKILDKSSIPGAWLAAAIFAIHPIHVESVSWVVELKDILSGFLYLGSFLSFINYTNTHNKFLYGLSLLLFLCAILSKSMVVTLPIAILLWLWWKNSKLTKNNIIHIIPFLIISIVLSVLDLNLNQQHTPFITNLNYTERLLISSRAIWFYFYKLVWPVNLMTFYPIWEINIKTLFQYIYPLSLILILGLLMLLKRSGLGMLVAIIYFIITLSPTLGLIDFGFMIYSLVADRFQYLACIGIFALFSTIFINLKLPRQVVLSISTIIVITLGILTWNQNTIYQNSDSLFKYNLKKNPNAWSTYLVLGLNLTNEGKYNEAENYFNKVLQIRPENMDALNNLAFIYSRQGKNTQAINCLNEIIRVKPHDSDSYNNRGVLYAQQDNLDDAIKDFNLAIQIKPDNVEAYNNLGQCLIKKNKINEAIQQFNRALTIKPDYPNARENLEKAQEILNGEKTLTK